MASSSVDVISKLKADRAIRDIESSHFEQRSFTSSSDRNKCQKSNAVTKCDDEVIFEFGTSAEKAVMEKSEINENLAMSKLMLNIAGEGLCHPNLFGDREKREERWLQYLLGLRKNILVEKCENTHADIINIEGS